MTVLLYFYEFKTRLSKTVNGETSGSTSGMGQKKRDDRRRGGEPTTQTHNTYAKTYTGERQVSSKTKQRETGTQIKNRGTHT